MGLPVTASYIVLATLSAPALSAMIAELRLVDVIAAGTLPDEAKAIFMLVAPESIAALGSAMSNGDALALVKLVPADLISTLQQQALAPAVLTMSLLSAHMIIFWLSQDSNITPPVCLTAYAAAAIAKTKPMATGFAAWKIAKALYLIPILFAFTPLLGGTFWQVAVIFLFGCLGLYAFAGALDGHWEAPLGRPQRLVLFFAGAALFWPDALAAQLAALAVVAALVYANLRVDRRNRIVADAG